MPLLEAEYVQGILQRYRDAARICAICHGAVMLDYCRSCDAFYDIHSPGCIHDDRKDHYRHRSYLIPYVEDRTR